MSEDNGQVATADAEQVVAEAADERPWLDADALMPLDYIRGKTALAAVLAEHKMGSCYELLAGETMYPWCIWAIKSRDDPDYTWEQAIREPFWQFRIGDDHRPPLKPAPPRSSPGSAGTTSGEPSATPKPPPRARGRSSASGSG
jgi:hypothetical protein